MSNWDEERARWMVGKTVLVGITRLEADGETVIDQEQFFGTIETADRVRGVGIRCAGTRAGETQWLPPDTRWFDTAAPGRYRLRGTGETVTDPDVLAQWSIRKPAN